VPSSAAASVHAWLVWVALPAFTLLHVPELRWSPDLVLPAVAPVIVLVGAVLFFSWGSRPAASRAALVLAAGLANTSFVGFPLVEAYYGDAGLSVAIVCDQVSFVLLSTAGVAIAVRGSAGGSLSIPALALRVVPFPPFVAFVLAILLPRFVDLAPLRPLIEPLARTVGPLALFAIGLSLETDGLRAELPTLARVLGYKLLIAPALVLGLGLAIGAHGLALRISVFEAAMASMASTAIVAAEQKLDVKLISLVIGSGIVISLATTAGWWWLLEQL
jgi:predicted permease